MKRDREMGGMMNEKMNRITDRTTDGTTDGALDRTTDGALVRAMNRPKSRKAGRKLTCVMAAAVLFAVSVAACAYGAENDISQFLTGGNPNAGGDYSGTEDAADMSDYPVTGDDMAGTGDYTAQTGGTSAQSMSMVTCTDDQTGINVARAAVPEGYSVNSQTIWCGSVQCPQYPVEVFIDAFSPDGSTELTYESPVQFVELIDCSFGDMQLVSHQDWTISPDYMTVMLRYMNASQYCDYVSQTCMPGTSGMTFVSETTPTQEEQAQLQQVSQAAYDESNAFLSSNPDINVDFVETTIAERTYHYTDANGKAKALVVSCAVQGVEMVSRVNGYGMGDYNTTVMIWSILGRYCLMTDLDQMENNRPVFDFFKENTIVSDQFKQACSEMSNQITQAVMNARSQSISDQTSYIQDAFSSELSSQDDTYSSMEAWDDVIMDRNDYTLSNGDSVKVDTSYDYVYEMPDGNVYATNSALDEPAGGTLLYAN